MFFVALGLVGALGTAAVYGIGALMVVDGSIEVGTLVALAALVTRVYQPLTGLTNARVDLMTSMVSFERVFEVLDAPEAIQEKPGAVDLVEAVGTIDFDNVVFRYPPASATAIPTMEQNAGLGVDTDPDVDVLQGLSLSVAAGETVALVGASGAGKSTTISLVPRLYDVTEGAVRIDGIDVRDLTLDSLRTSIGVVSQDPHLFHESIGDNLRYADPTATDDQLIEAARAGAHPRDDRSTARRVCDDRRRTRLPVVRRGEATARDRAPVAEEPGDHDPRRGHEPSRQRQRGPHPRGPGSCPRGADRSGHRASPVDDSFC